MQVYEILVQGIISGFCNHLAEEERGLVAFSLIAFSLPCGSCLAEYE